MVLVTNHSTKADRILSGEKLGVLSSVLSLYGNPPSWDVNVFTELDDNMNDDLESGEIAIGAQLTSDQQEEVLKMLEVEKKFWSLTDSDIGCSSDPSHCIKLTN